MTTAAPAMDQGAFLDDVQSGLETIADGINDVIGRAEDRIRSALNKAKWFGIGAALAARELWDRFLDAAQRLVDRFTEFCRDVWKAVQQVLGNPAALYDIGMSYRSAAAILDGNELTVSRSTAALGGSWEGRAFDAYRVVAGEQAAAMTGVQQALVSAGGMLAEASEELVTVWLDQIKNVQDTGLDLMSTAGGFADAGNIVTFEIGPVLDVLATALKGVVNGVHIWLEYATGMITTNAQWLDVTLGVDGLPGGQWPAPGPLQGPVVRDPEEWDAKGR